MYIHRRLNLQELADVQLLHRAYGWNAKMPGWYKAMADAPSWQDFLAERKQASYANFLIFNQFGTPVSLIAFSSLGNDDYETHLISARSVDADDLFDVMVTLRDGIFQGMKARMLVANTADCNIGMKRLLRRLGFEPTESIEEKGLYKNHVIRVRLWRMVA